MSSLLLHLQTWFSRVCFSTSQRCFTQNIGRQNHRLLGMCDRIVLTVATRMFQWLRHRVSPCSVRCWHVSAIITWAGSFIMVLPCDFSGSMVKHTGASFTHRTWGSRDFGFEFMELRPNFANEREFQRLVGRPLRGCRERGETRPKPKRRARSDAPYQPRFNPCPSV